MTPTPPAAASPEFAALGLGPELQNTLAALGYEEPTAIQRLAIPHLLEGRDLLGLAATGTGKTAAFALPLLQLIECRRPVPGALVLVPTRELAIQVAQAIHRYGRELGVEVLPIYGGQSFQQQLKVLKRGVDVVVATPGRALDHLRRGTLNLERLRVLVLDEADEMLDMGFAEDLEAILDAVPTNRQTLLFSATLAPRIEAIATRHLKDPVDVRVTGDTETEGEVPRVRQVAYLVRRPHKLAALGRVLDIESPEAALVFCRTRNEVDELVEALNGRGYRSEALHGGMSQEERDRVMKKLRGGAVDLLVATDVAARGLDIAHLTHVVNYDVPSAPKSYVHRIGRVGRAGREGVAITLAEPREHALLRNIEQLTRQRITLASVPTVADLHAKRMELTRATVREAILDGGLERFRSVAAALSDEFDLMDIALGAVKLAHEAVAGSGEEDDEEIPEERPFREKTRGEKGPARGTRGKARESAGMTRIFVGMGRAAGVRPQDLVGAIAGEAGVRGRQVGAIQIAERFAIVEVADDVAQDVLAALRATKIKGKKVTVKIDGGGRGPRR